MGKRLKEQAARRARRKARRQASPKAPETRKDPFDKLLPYEEVPFEDKPAQAATNPVLPASPSTPRLAEDEAGGDS